MMRVTAGRSRRRSVRARLARAEAGQRFKGKQIERKTAGRRMALKALISSLLKAIQSPQAEVLTSRSLHPGVRDIGKQRLICEGGK